MILLYHRIFEAASDPQLLCVRPKHFAEHLEYLREHFLIIRLSELINTLKDGTLPKRGVVITFDDGYADNLWNAKPLLERYEVPATVFVTTGYLGQGREFWWDELERLLLQPGALPETLLLSINGNTYEWRLGEAAFYSEAEFERYRRWHVEEKDDPTLRHALYRTLHKRLRPLPVEERQKVLNSLLGWAGVKAMVRPTHCPLSSDEVFCLAEGSLVEVGVHTVTHPVLSTLPVAAQRAEILGSKARLEEILGHPVMSFAYPYGSRTDYPSETVAIIREAGFACACSNFADLVWRGTDPFQLPRVLVRDWDGDELARRLGKWFHG